MLFITALIANSDKIIMAMFAIQAAAVAIANLTPTPKDNAFLVKSYRVIEVLAGIITKQAKN